MLQQVSIKSVIDHAKEVVEIEASGIQELSNRIDKQFELACHLIQRCEGRIVVIGMGKSGHIGGKISSTLASTGTPSFFVHPCEARHGDLGMITQNDVVMIISNSGETEEIISIIPILKRLEIKMLAVTGNSTSTLAKLSDACLNVRVDKEACPYNLVPTASTTAALVMGDALAVVVQRLRGFSAHDFARTHPGGVLGKRLLLCASDIMHQCDEFPLVNEKASMQELLLTMISKSFGMSGVINKQGNLLGMFTDEDIGRLLKQKVDVYHRKVVDLMRKDPFTIRGDTLAEDIVKLMQCKSPQKEGLATLNNVFVVDEKNIVVGAINKQDLLKVGII